MELVHYKRRYLSVGVLGVGSDVNRLKLLSHIAVSEGDCADSQFFCNFRTTQALVVDALADKRLYEQELARTREENAFLQDQVRKLRRTFSCTDREKLL